MKRFLQVLGSSVFCIVILVPCMFACLPDCRYENKSFVRLVLTNEIGQIITHNPTACTYLVRVKGYPDTLYMHEFELEPK